MKSYHKPREYIPHNQAGILQYVTITYVTTYFLPLLSYNNNFLYVMVLLYKFPMWTGLPTHMNHILENIRTFIITFPELFTK